MLTRKSRVIGMIVTYLIIIVSLVSYGSDLFAKTSHLVVFMAASTSTTTKTMTANDTHWKNGENDTKKDATIINQPIYSGRKETSSQCASILGFIASRNDVFKTDSNLTQQHQSDTKNQTTFVSVHLPSIHELWEQVIHPQLLPHAINFTTLFLQSDLSRINVTRMQEDYQYIHDATSLVTKLLPSMVHPMPPTQMHSLLRIIDLRLQNPNENPPLHIMIFGGSVVEGVNSHAHSWWDHPFELFPHSRHMEKLRWTSRFESVLNEILFHGQSVVRITNWGSGGGTSDEGALGLRYRLFQKQGVPPPDLIIHSYAQNDIRMDGGDDESLLVIQEFIQAAKQSRCDTSNDLDDDLPAILLYDDFLGLLYTQEDGIRKDQDVQWNLRYSRTVSQVAAWFDVHAVSYANAFRHQVMAAKGFGDFADKTHSEVLTDPAWRLPMLGWRLELHPGMLYHSTSPWILLFSFIFNMINTCQDIKEIYRNSHQDPSLLHKISAQHLPPLSRDVMLKDVPMLWKSNEQSYREICQWMQTMNQSDRKYKDVCTPSSWIVNRAGGLIRPRQITNQLNQLAMIQSDWTVEGRQTGQGKPRPGWVAMVPNATATLLVPTNQDIRSFWDLDIRFMTIISMISYGPKWMDSLLQIRISDLGNTSIRDKLVDNALPPTLLHTWNVSGYHVTETSVFVAHKFPLEVPSGHSFQIQMDLIGGSTFKIKGMLFCAL